MRQDHAYRGADHFEPKRRIVQQAARLFDQFVAGFNTPGSATLHQFFGQARKIFHVRSEDHWFAGDDWFDRILPTVRSDTLSNENYGCDRVPIAQLARAIGEKTVYVSR